MSEYETECALRSRIQVLETERAELRRELAARDRYIEELRAAIDALMHPPPSELLAKNRAHPSRQYQTPTLSGNLTLPPKIRPSGG